MDFLEDLYRLVVRNPHLLLIMLFVVGSVVRSVVQGLTQAKRRKEEVEQRRESRGQKPIDIEDMFEPQRPEPETPYEEVLTPQSALPPPVQRPQPEPIPVPAYFEVARPPLAESLTSREVLVPSFEPTVPAFLAQSFGEGLTLSAEAPEAEGVAAPRSRAAIAGLPHGVDDWRGAILLTEVLGPPVSMRTGFGMPPLGSPNFNRS